MLVASLDHRTTQSALLSGAPGNSVQDDEGYEYIEPIAESIFNRKQLSNLEQNLGNLRCTSRAQHETVMKLEADMQSAVSMQDLQHTIGLALEEVDGRMEEVFKESNQKMLSLFARRGDVNELQSLIGKKVNWADHHKLIKKHGDLQTYFETTTQSIFVNHIEAVNRECSKKADASDVDAAMKIKADVTDMVDLQARLERLEALCAHAKTEHAAALQALEDQTAANLRMRSDKHEARVNVVDSALAEIQVKVGGIGGVLERMTGIESDLDRLSGFAHENREVNNRLQKEHKNYLLDGIKSLQDQLGQLDSLANRTSAELETLKTGTKEFQTQAQDSFKDLRAQVMTAKQQEEFLMNATEMLKRKSREANKLNDSRLQELSDEQEKLLQQMVSLECEQKRHEREASRGGVQCKYAVRSPTPDGRQGDQEDERSLGLLDQLAKIASTCPQQQDQAPALVDLHRPALPWFAADGRPCTQGLDQSNLPRFPSPAPFSALSRPPSTSARARLGTTPRSKSARGARK